MITKLFEFANKKDWIDEFLSNLYIITDSTVSFKDTIFYFQELIQQDYGDVASLYFSDFNNIEENWNSYSSLEKISTLIDYLEYEDDDKYDEKNHNRIQILIKILDNIYDNIKDNKPLIDKNFIEKIKREEVANNFNI